MAVMKDEAIVLRRLDYSETSQVLAVFTHQYGLQRLIAKGVKRGTRKRFAVGIDLLERGVVAFLARTHPEGTLGTLTEWRQLEPYLGLRTDLVRWYAAQYAAEVTAAMLEDADPHPLLFEALAGLLTALSGAGAVGERGSAPSPALPLSRSPASVPSAAEHPLPLLCTYQQALLAEAGLWPDLTRCVMCDRPAPPGRAAWYSAHQGGLVCRNCEGALLEKRKVASATVTALREGRFSGDTAAGVFEVLDYTISHLIGRQPALSQLMKAVIPGRG
jgi:DNA repair protein RecO (recombination protein O)